MRKRYIALSVAAALPVMGLGYVQAYKKTFQDLRQGESPYVAHCSIMTRPFFAHGCAIATRTYFRQQDYWLGHPRACIQSKRIRRFVDDRGLAENFDKTILAGATNAVQVGQRLGLAKDNWRVRRIVEASQHLLKRQKKIDAACKTGRPGFFKRRSSPAGAPLQTP